MTEFYFAALAAGGRCDGEPGIRPNYHAGYFAAFVLDPDGHRLEVVCHTQPKPREVVMENRRHQVLIRRATGTDADTVAALARAFHAEDGHPLSDPGVHALLLMLEPGFEDGLVLLLEVDGKTSGYGILSFGYGIEHGGAETFLEDIYVLPECRGLGFGATLIEELERRAKESGLKAIHLEVMPGNWAEHWYRRMGWSDRGSRLLTKPI